METNQVKVPDKIVLFGKQGLALHGYRNENICRTEDNDAHSNEGN